MSDFLDQKRAEITKRLNELKPMVDEYQRLEEAARALAGVTGSRLSAPARATAPAKRAGATRRRGPGRPRKSATAAASTAAATTPKRRGGGRPKGSGQRAAQAVELVGKNPGITIPELAGKMGIKQNYLYRVLPPLEKEGKVSRQGRGWFPS